MLFLLMAVNGFAQTPYTVTTYQDANGWKLQVDGEDYFVKGVVWAYTPIGENYSYNLWGNPDEFIMKVLDYECGLMKQAGINTIRSFGIIPPRWVTYIYREHGIMTIMNHLMGRYGYNVGGAWIPQTNYADRLTRETLKRDIVSLVQQYKDVPGVLMFALGNENNYGLEWSSFEIENLPVGEQHREKAKFLYSLFEEIIAEAKKAAPQHLFTIVNGDIQYLDLIAKQCKSIDLLGVNAYRGISFTDMWSRVHKELGLPVMLTEFGSDAFNALEHREDQAGQAYIVKGNWQEIYNKSHGHGEEGNAVGGTLFEWRDEWWKYLQEENLYVQDTHASWSNGGYAFDYVEGVNNMNEEWFGICRLGWPNDDGVYVAEPRMAYDVLAKIWRINPYAVDKAKMNEKFASIDMELLKLVADVRLLKSEKRKSDAIRITGGSLRGDLVFNGLAADVEANGKNGLDFSHGEMLFLDFEFNPISRIKGDFTLNILGNVVDKQLDEYYGKRGQTYVTVITEPNANGLEVNTTREVNDAERLEVYDFQTTYMTDHFDLTAFYHIPRYHWGYEGDFFGLLYEATDMEGMDIWNAKAPYGVEFTGNKFLPGFTLLTGPEIYWGANPKAMLKYDFGGNKFKYTLIHAEDFAQAAASATATEATSRATRQTALTMETKIIPRTKLQLGYLFAGSEKLDDVFYYYEDGNVYQDKIELMDTQGAKAKITVDAFSGSKIDAAVHYAGLVADGGSPLREFNTTMPFSSLGNKLEFEGGMLVPIGNFWLLPRALYRTNLLDSNPSLEPSIDGTDLFPGLTPRNRDKDPFAVLDNRQALSGEFFLTYDPTPASFFYAWDSDKKEDARFAFSIGGNFTRYETVTDANLFYYQEGKTNAPFGSGMPAADVWLAKGRFVLNPNPRLKLIANLEGGKQQASGNPDGELAEYISLATDLVIAKKHYLSAYAKKDAWGPLDWYRQFNITFPYQFMLDYSVLIDNILDKTISSRLGFRTLFRTLNANSPVNEGAAVNSDYQFQTGVYLRHEF
ncbi:MAG: hypothetical protein K0B87_00385 [Candidatus Syntrophosphaera sp.]|nr:hypothetical protein [Candidatus Syntrophosphaera sp.]